MNEEPPRIEFTQRFDKQLKKAPPEIKEAFIEALELFLENPMHPNLQNHALGKKLTGYRSIDVTGDWRAVFKEKQTNEQKVIVFDLFGTHKDLYG